MKPVFSAELPYPVWEIYKGGGRPVQGETLWCLVVSCRRVHVHFMGKVLWE
jgi:hypothetical protein